MEQAGPKKQRHVYRHTKSELPTGTGPQLWAGLNHGFQERRASEFSLCIPSYQEFSPLFPMAALGIGAAMGLRSNVDQVPLLWSGLWSLLQRANHLLLSPPLPVLLNQLALGHPLRII